jgi:hypothetical protein
VEAWTAADVPGVTDVDRRGGTQWEDGWVFTDSYKSCVYLLGVVGTYVSTLIIYFILISFFCRIYFSSWNML